MNKKLSTLALILGLAGSLAFAGEKKKSNSASDQAATRDMQVAYDKTTQDNNNPCSNDKNSKDKSRDKASPTQEQQFDEVLRGIYG